MDIPAERHQEHIEPEFARPRGVSKLGGISERTVGDWIAAGVIESHLVLSPGRKKARIRLVNLESVRRFIRGQANPAATDTPADQTEGASQ